VEFERSLMKKNNHYIPRCLLKRWLTNNGTYDGVHYLDIRTKKIGFSSANGRKAYSFASVDNLYILDADSNRKANLEDWFSGLENSFSLFIDRVERKQSEEIFKEPKHLTLLMMGLISFEFRSPYVIKQGIEFLNDNPDILNDFDGKSPFQIILENVVIGTTEYANQYPQVEFVISKSPSPILLVDRPLVLDDDDQFSIFPLTPELVLSFKRVLGTSTITYNEISDELAQQLNNTLIVQARNWIVSNDLSQLENIEVKDTPDDKVIFEKIKHLMRGYEF